MKKEAVFLFGPSDLIGTVAAVDTTRVSVSVSNASIVSHLSIANLVAIKGATEAEYLIGLIERVTSSNAALTPFRKLIGPVMQ